MLINRSRIVFLSDDLVEQDDEDQQGVPDARDDDGQAEGNGQEELDGWMDIPHCSQTAATSVGIRV